LKQIYTSWNKDPQFYKLWKHVTIVYICPSLLNNLWHHQSNSSAWIMAKYMDQLVFTNTCLAIQKARFISIYVDEGIIMDCQSWFSFHVHSWKHVPILLTLEQMVNGGKTNNFKKVVMGIVLQFGNLSKSNIASKLMIWHRWHFNFLWGNNKCHNTICKEKHVPCMLRVRLHLIIGAFTYIYMW
jgi:hypothetical protein